MKTINIHFSGDGETVINMTKDMQESNRVVHLDNLQDAMAMLQSVYNRLLDEHYVQGWPENVPTSLHSADDLPDTVTTEYKDRMDIGDAVAEMMNGHKVQRKGWNGKGMFLYYVPENKYPASRNTLKTMEGVFPENMVPYGAYVAMKTAQDNVVPWLASQTDLLATDWQVVT